MRARASDVVETPFRAMQVVTASISASGGQDRVTYSGSIDYGDPVYGSVEVTVSDNHGNSRTHSVPGGVGEFSGSFGYDVGEETAVRLTVSSGGSTLGTDSTTVGTSTSGGDGGSDGGDSGNGDGPAVDMWMVAAALVALGGGAIALSR